MKMFFALITGLLISTTSMAQQKALPIPCGDYFKANIFISAGTVAYDVSSGKDCKATAVGTFSRNFSNGYPFISGIKKCGDQTYYLLSFLEIVGGSTAWVNVNDADVNCLE